MLVKALFQLAVLTQLYWLLRDRIDSAVEIFVFRVGVDMISGKAVMSLCFAENALPSARVLPLWCVIRIGCPPSGGGGIVEPARGTPI